MLASSSDFGDVLQRDNCSTQCERSDETLVLASFLCADSVIQGGHRSREVCGVGEHWNETHGRLFNDNPKCEGREAGFCERLCKSDGALFLGGSLLLVLSLRGPVFVWMLSSSWLLILIRECVEACGSLVPM